MVSMTWYDYLNMTSFPAKQVSDGQDTYTFAPRPGQMFTLPKNMDIDAYAKEENLDEVTVMIMKAVQKYGGIITDHNMFTDAFNFEHPAGVGAYARDGKNVWQEDPTVASKISNFRQDYFPLEKLQWLDINYAGQATATETADLTPAATAPIGQGQVQQYSAVDAIYQDERTFMRPSDYVAAGAGVTMNQARNVPDGTTDLYNTSLVGNEYTPTATWYQYPRDLRAAIPVSGFTGQLVKYWTNPAIGAPDRVASADSVQTKDHGTVAKWTVNVVAKDQPLARTDTVSVAPGKTISVDVFANDSSEYGKADGATAFTSLKLINSKGQAVDAINTKRGYAKVNGNKINFTALASSNGQITFTYQGTTADGRKSTGALEIRMLGKVTSYTSADVAEISDPIPNQAGTYTPVYSASNSVPAPGSTVTFAAPKDSNGSALPSGTTFKSDNAAFKVASDGSISVAVPANAKNGDVLSAKITVTYPDGSTEVVTAKVTVTDKTAPVISAIANQTVTTGKAITNVTVKTNDSAATVAVSGLPAGVSYNAQTGVISGAPTKTGTSTVTVKAVDGSGNVSTKTFTIKVNAVPMTNSNTPSYINGFGVPGVALSILAPTNVNGSSVSEGTTFVSDNPAFVVDDSGNITVQVPADAKDGDVLTANITVTYADGTTDVLPVSVTVSDTVAPLVSDIADQSATKGQEIEPIAVKASETAAKVTVSGLPEGASYNAETGTISGTPTATGNYTVSVLATDLSGNSSTRNFTMTVAEEGAQASEPTTPVETPAPAETTPAPAPSEPVTAEPNQPAQPVDTTAPVESAEPVAPVATEPAEASQPAESNAPVAEAPNESAQATQSTDSAAQPVADSAQSEQQQAAPAHFAAQVDTSASQASAGTVTSDPSNVSVSSNQVVDSETGETTTESAVPFTFGGGNASNGGVYSYSDQGTTAGHDYYQSGGQESALAYTGANVVGWGLAGISALVGGVVVLGARRRKEEN